MAPGGEARILQCANSWSAWQFGASGRSWQWGARSKHRELGGTIEKRSVDIIKQLTTRSSALRRCPILSGTNRNCRPDSAVARLDSRGANATCSEIGGYIG
jgi:hypothetical protein